MNSYPLYDELIKRIEEKENKIIDNSQMCATINSLAFMDKKSASEHYEEIYVLLLHHEFIVNQGVLFSKIPNDGKTLPGDNGVLYTAQKLPVKAKQLVNEYIEYYSKK